MADQGQIDVLMRGTLAWNAWREAHPAIVQPDLSRADLGGAHLHGADLRKADLTKADLGGAGLVETSITAAFFRT
jgi:uncharacterized protein YjbI with pentapeptide repeats